MKSIVILYHSDCEDGFGGAWAAWKKFGNRATYIPIKHQTPPPPGLTNKTIFIIDIFYPIPVLKRLIRENKRIVALDHHKSREAETKFAPEYVFDLNRSGAVIAWNYFHPRKKVPHLLGVIQERDLWKFKTRDSKQLFAYLEMQPLDFHAWNIIAKQWENSKVRQEHGKLGEVILTFQHSLIGQLVKHAQKGTFQNKSVWIVNSPFFEDQVGNLLAKKGPHITLVWRQYGGMIRVSLRSTKAVDVSKLAAPFGGGGHPQSAGFRIPANKPVPWRISKP